MGKSYSQDIRRRVMTHIEGGHSRREAAERFNVSPSFAVKLADRVAQTGSAQPARQGRPAGSGKLSAHVGVLIAWVNAQADITMPELAAKLKEERGVEAHPASLSRALLAAGFSFKKNAAGIRVRARGRSARA